MSKIFNSIIANFKSQFIPVRDEKLRCTMDGTIACPSNGEYHAFINGELTNVPEELLIKVPVYRITKPISQLQPGDVIKTCSNKTMKDGTVNPEGKFTYRLVKSVTNGKIATISFSGADSKITPVKDFFLGQKTVSVVVNLFAGIANGGTTANAANGVNPMLLLALASDGDSDGLKDMLPFLMMQGGAAGANGINPMMLLALKDGDSKIDDILPFLLMQGGAAGMQGFNPLMLLALKDGDSDLSSLLMMQAFAGNGAAGVNPLANLFGGFGAPAAPAAPAVDPEVDDDADPTAETPVDGAQA